MNRASLPLLALALAACGPSITVTQNPSVPLPGPATYVWGPPPANVPNGSGIVAQSPLLNQRVKAAIERDLQQKGYHPADSTQAEFLVRFAIATKATATQVNDQAATGSGVVSSNVCGGASCWGGWDYGPPTDVQTMQSGVVVDLVDRKSGTLAWRGIYKRDATGKVPSQQEVDQAVEKLMAKLPAVGK
jgi:hypothetical protein